MKRKYGLILLGNSLIFFTLFAIFFKATFDVYEECVIALNLCCTPSMEYARELQGLFIIGCSITIIFLLGTVLNVFMLINMVDKEEIK